MQQKKKDHIQKLHNGKSYHELFNEYWTELETYIFGRNVEDDLSHDEYYIDNDKFITRLSHQKYNAPNSTRWNNLIYIRENFALYRTTFNNLIVIHPNNIILFALYISSLYSLNPSPPLFLNNSAMASMTLNDDPSRLIVVMRKDGLFKTQEYLDALFDGYFLVGCPIMIAPFDTQIGSPITFIKHDFDHIKDIQRAVNLESLNKHKNIYEQIQSDYELELILQKLFIDTLFVLLHEENIFLFSYNTLSDDPDLYSDFDFHLNQSISFNNQGLKMPVTHVDDSKIERLFQRFNYVDKGAHVTGSNRTLVYGKILLVEYVTGRIY